MAYAAYYCRFANRKYLAWPWWRDEGAEVNPAPDPDPHDHRGPAACRHAGIGRELLDGGRVAAYRDRGGRAARAAGCRLAVRTLI
jgi:hypothetical protein